MVSTKCDSTTDERLGTAAYLCYDGCVDQPSINGGDPSTECDSQVVCSAIGTSSLAKRTSSPTLEVSRRSEDFMAVDPTAGVSMSANSGCAYREVRPKFKDTRTGVGGSLRFVSKFVAATSAYATIVVSRHVKPDFDPWLSESHGNVSGSTSRVVIPGRAVARVYLDDDGSHPEVIRSIPSSCGYEYILTVMDHIPNWFEA